MTHFPSSITIDTENGPQTFEPAPGDSRVLSDLLADRGFPLNTRCGKRGICRGCEVELLEGSLTVGEKTISAPATVRACRARPAAGPATLAIPARSHMEHRPQIGDTFRIDVPAAHQPLFDPEPGGRDTAFAVDIGTTTVAVLLIDLATGALLSRASDFNQQIRFGDNVLTRIDACRDPVALRAMQTAIAAETIAPLLERALQRADLPASRIAGGVVAGNTAMLHLLLGVDPTPLGVAPFTPRFIESRATTCGALGLAAASPDTPVRLLPGIAAYIGADIAAGIYATGMLYDNAPSLLVDIGTNGEVVLQNQGRLAACATAAGPAFEGAGLRAGSRARHGAVSALHLSADPFRIDAKTIGDVPPARATGICGSAYIDFLAETRECELLTPTGRFDADAWAALPSEFRDDAEGERALRLGTARTAPAVSEVDIAVILQAKAAIGAGIETLLESAGIAPADISRLYLAGGFGMHLDVAHAIEIGLLPGFDTEQVEVVGNTALAGALLAAIDRTTLKEMESLRTGVDVLELNLQDNFENRYIEHLMLP
jgi:uncharacterized 2Fe-2S/4Fe-4S cluster protein (DUF4445 family)